MTYGAVSPAEATLDWNGEVQVSVDVTNAGDRAVIETVQLYIRDRVADLTQPGRRLRDFRKVELAAGETKTVSFTLRRERLEYVGADGRPTVQPGAFDIWLTSSAQAGSPGTLILGARPPRS